MSKRPEVLVIACLIAMIFPASGPAAWAQTVEEPLLGRGGFIPVFGGLGQTASITAGLRYDLFLRHPRLTLAVDALGSIRGYAGFRGTAGFENDQLAVYAYGRYRYMPREVFNGFGTGSSKETAGDYRIDDRTLGMSVSIRLARIVAVGSHLSLLDKRFGDGRHGDYPPVHEIHDAYGIGLNSRYLAAGAWLELDGREYLAQRGMGNRFAPVEQSLRGLDLSASRGWYVALEATPHVGATDGANDFLQVQLEGQLYVPMGFDSDGLAFRSHLTTTFSSSDEVPFYMLPALGGSSSIRGFAAERFRDDHALLLNAEYRRNLLLFLDVAAFVDAGQTFSDTNEISLANMEYGYGLGFRLRVGRSVLGRIDVAHSKEGFALYLRAGTFL